MVATITVKIIPMMKREQWQHIKSLQSLQVFATPLTSFALGQNILSDSVKFLQRVVYILKVVWV